MHRKRELNQEKNVYFLLTATDNKDNTDMIFKKELIYPVISN